MSLPSTHFSIWASHGKNGKYIIDWTQFVTIYYQPLLIWFGCKGIQKTDAEDLTQKCIEKLYEKIDSYHFKKGKFRYWLCALMKNLLMDFHRDRQRHPGNVPKGGSIALEQLENLCSDASIDDLRSRLEQIENSLLSQAMAIVKSRVAAHTWQAFEDCELNQRVPKIVAKQLTMTVGAVHVARYRVLAMLKVEYFKLIDANNG